MNTECIESKFAQATHGYPMCRLGTKSVLHHRLVYCLAHGIELKTIKGLSVMHKCDNTMCVNPDHLVLGTHTDNMQDKMQKGRGNHKSGVDHGRATISAETAAKIKELLAADRHECTEIAVMCSTTKHVVYNIKRGKTWSNLT